jgi:hypothetical protein
MEIFSFSWGSGQNVLAELLCSALAEKVEARADIALLDLLSDQHGYEHGPSP